MYLYGGDYNPEQWIGDIDLVKADVAKLKDANINTVTIGMFSWSMLEPTEGEYNLEWLKKILDILKTNDMKVIYGTPTAARPHWLAQKYPATSRINSNGQRNLSGARHNHCMTSEVFREKAKIIIEKTVELVSKYDNIHSWHINNEFGGDCYCSSCQHAFREHLKMKYGTIEKLNQMWWNTFWSHNYSSFDEIEPPLAYGDQTNTPLKINWEFYKTTSHINYYRFESEIIKKYSALPITTNFHGDPFNFSLDYYRFGKEVDYISYDIYPQWNSKNNFDIAIEAKLDLLTQVSIDKDKDFYIMESTPGSTNWHPYTILKSDKLHYASTFLQMLVGSKSYLYFQLKQSRGSSEKYHGSVLDINSNTNHRVYKYCETFGDYLKQLAPFSEVKLEKKVGIYLDWNNLAMLNFSEGPRNIELPIKELYVNLVKYYNNIGVNVEIFYDEKDIEQFETVLFPYSYHVKQPITNKIKDAKLKNVIAFPLLNYVNNDDLLYLGDAPHNLSELFGVTVEEFNAVLNGDTIAGDKYSYEVLTEVVEPKEAKVIDSFEHEILNASLTKNTVKSTDYYYFGGIPTFESLTQFLDNIHNKKYIPTRKIVSSTLVIDNQHYEYLINFGEESVDLSREVVWSTNDNKTILNKYDFAICKI